MSGMLSLQNNLLAMGAARTLGISTNSKAKSTKKLSSGFKINTAADDAAGLSISEKLRMHIRGLSQGKENTQDGISWTQIGDGAMEEITDMVHRVTELAVKGANGTLTADDRMDIDKEIQHLKKEINRIGGANTNFNTLPIFDNSCAMLNVEGTPDDFQLFDSSYDPSTGKAGFGGIFYNGEGLSWD